MLRNRLFTMVGALALLLVSVLTARMALATSETISATQRAQTAYAARWTGLAIQEYVPTGNRDVLPTCVPSDVMAMLPRIGDGTWRADVTICHK